MKLVKEAEKILHRKLKEVKEITPEIRESILEMKKVMKDSFGIGLAANQVGIDLKLFVIDTKIAEHNSVPEVYINPEITEYSRESAFMEEGCLSIPDYWHQIKRSKKIKMKAMGEDGGKIRFKAKGMLARVLQHETDHINGVLIRDRADSPKSK